MRGDFFVGQPLHEEVKYAGFSRREDVARCGWHGPLFGPGNRDGDRLRQEGEFSLHLRTPLSAANPLVREEPASGQSEPLACEPEETNL